MRIGSDHQSEIQSFLKDSATDPRLNAQLEELVWKPGSITDEEIDMFCLLVRAVGTLGRAYDPSSTTRQPILLGAAAAAGRDITKQHAHDLLHKANYDLKKAVSLLLPGNQPVICRDQLEKWSPSEAQLFEEALDKYSKTFSEIQTESLPWKTHKSLVELYYFWKTTDRYVRQRRTKLAAQEHKWKQVYIPNYSKPNPAVLYNGSDKSGRGCEGCSATSSSQWYAWGPSNLLYRLCSSCWTYWKRYGGLKNLTPKERTVSSRNPPATKGVSHELDCKAAGPAASSTHTTDPFFNQSMEAPHPTHTVNPFLVGINPTGLRANHTPGSGTNNANSSTGRYADGMGLPAALAGAPRGTQCSKTAAVIRLAHILCRNLVRPLRLARRPGRHAGTTALQASSTGVGNKESGSVDQAVSLDVLCVAARPIIDRLPNPSALLSRPRQMPPVDEVIKSVAKRRGITLSTQDLTTIVLGVTNGSAPPTGIKRARPSVTSVLPCDNSVNAVDLVNGIFESGTVNSEASSPSSSTALGTAGPEGDTSPPPCKKQLLSGSSLPHAQSEVSNGLTIVTDDECVEPEASVQTVRETATTTS
ncbi:Metastasis-associated protein MTA1 [Fasciola hepatica]|uniref:Metastasis-associated protein MTA1 n=1 Tax=Fasciola hepatica TaxID=6192 RepID=A0A4E0QZP5_FASHE|nr:Metastasis-associated protein MTA1 [Fasciola hepatica]